MTSLDQPTLRRFVELAGERLQGDWVIFGGCVVPLLGGTGHVTFDIDVAGPDDSELGQLNELYRIAVELGLPPEAVNQAGAFFLRAIPGWRDELETLHAGSGARICVPTATLYVLSKIERLSDSDLDDCLERLQIAARNGGSLDRDRLRRAVREQAVSASSEARLRRLTTLQAALDEPR